MWYCCVVSIFIVTVSVVLRQWRVEGFLIVNNNYPQNHQMHAQALSFGKQRALTILASSSSSSSSRSFPPRRDSSQPQQRISSKRKKSIQDRTQAEFIDLAQDIVKTIVEAGPQAGPTRTFQAYLAVTNTLREFLLIPRPGLTTRSTSPEISIPRVLRSLFERLGATYIKLGQFIASSPTLFPKEYVVEFQKCLDATDPLEWSVIQNVIEAELGPISRTFAYVDRTPLASASIAQVHAAKLKTGEDVVLKVQKPGIDQLLKADLGFIYIASRLIEFWQPDWERTSLSAVVGDIRSSMLEELDFQKEATNMEEFRRFLREYDLLQVATAPKVYRKCDVVV
jgi:aarF domain-containing kinase